MADLGAWFADLSPGALREPLAHGSCVPGKTSARRPSSRSWPAQVAPLQLKLWKCSPAMLAFSHAAAHRGRNFVRCGG